MKVLKFGGTSVANAKNIKQVKQIVQNLEGQKDLVVVSALGGVTDLLVSTIRLAALQDISYKKSLAEIEERHINTIKELIPVLSQSPVLSKVKSELNTLEALVEGAFLIGENTPKLADKVLGYGELLSSYIIFEYFKTSGLKANFKDSREIIKTDSSYGKAVIDFPLTYKNIKVFKDTLKNGLTVLPGFIASSKDQTSTTLGRGGSDYTAAVLARGVEAEVLEIWTDVSGMYTANPRIVKQAKAIPGISYQEAMELSHFGAKVLYPPTIHPVLSKHIPIQIKNTFKPEERGTTITSINEKNEKAVRGLSNVDNISLLSLEGPGMIGIPGISKRFFEVISQAGISVVLITQASSEHSICVGIADNDASKAELALNKAFEHEIDRQKIYPVVIESSLAIVALVGDRMKSHQGLSGKMFSTLGKNNVNIRAIAQGASERNISAVIKMEDVKKALNTLHEAFFEENIRQLNLFVTGVGNVGSRFINQIKTQKKYLKKELKINPRIIGLSNSRKMAFDPDGIDLENWEDALMGGKKADSLGFYENIIALNLRNSIFVDNTASEKIALLYKNYLRQSIAVVCCNKIACSSAIDNYLELKHLSREYEVPFLFETNVGAGLPIIDTLKHLIASGDRIHKIRAVLSGSLNFVFNNFAKDTTFAEIVKRAQEEGYTEPDPKIDLSGVDVMRKILILARESGFALDITDIKNESFLSEHSLSTKNNKDFYASLREEEGSFQALLAKAAESDSKLKYVAEFENGKAKVGLEYIPKGHDFYHLEGSDNIVLFYTDRYPTQPLIIKGAGAGADVTASGIFADIIRIGNF
ncbi:bifunctional aspartate kinase/homoserine dehydrogenase I [Eudoraea chungangensis]|uniref:bifunctional aspartate kinase/homoserine dehydrogenase I n=1 Tax=Eudoraea chungangensis TaxID=1481905 RepID=UPI0023EC8EE1|nr:bifunctional aspartate kinase/homoserine dehydrogenase I [Eudoraea chungangensis]